MWVVDVLGKGRTSNVFRGYKCSVDAHLSHHGGSAGRSETDPFGEKISEASGYLASSTFYLYVRRTVASSVFIGLRD